MKNELLKTVPEFGKNLDIICAENGFDSWDCQLGIAWLEHLNERLSPFYYHFYKVPWFFVAVFFGGVLVGYFFSKRP